VEILKPRTDKREYRRVVLPNDLQVLIISDPDTDKVACCFCCLPVFFSPFFRFLSL
jgi:secreted Zn-dependent insulinase-like peptidase